MELGDRGEAVWRPGRLREATPRPRSVLEPEPGRRLRSLPARVPIPRAREQGRSREGIQGSRSRAAGGQAIGRADQGIDRTAETGGDDEVTEVKRTRPPGVTPAAVRGQGDVSFLVS